MDLTPDPLETRLAATIRARLAASPVPGDEPAALRGVEAQLFEAPVDMGGYDLGVGCGVLVTTELGRAVRPDVYSGGAVVLDAASLNGDRSGLAARVAGGDVVVLPAGFAGAPLAAQRGTSGWELSGRVSTTRLPGEQQPDVWQVLPVRTGGTVVLAVVSANRWRSRAVHGPGDTVTLALDGLPLRDDDIVAELGSGSDWWEDPAGLLARARLRAAAYLVGLGESALDHASTHAGDRRQFGAPLLDFQAVAFPLARSSVLLSATRALVARTAWLADAGEPVRQAAAETLALAAETAMSVARRAVQTFGASGLTLGQPVSHIYTTVRHAAARFGPPSVLWREAGQLRLSSDAELPTAAV